MTGDRVRVTSPKTVKRSRRQRTAAEEIDEATRLGEIYMQSLIEYQLRIAGAAAFLIAMVLGGLPLAFLFSDVLDQISIGPVPLPWFILGFGVYPLVITIAWIYVIRVERAEDDFVRLMDEP